MDMNTFGSFFARIACCTLVAFWLVPPSSAQLVLIPDHNLRSALNEWVPGAVDASGYLDTGNPAVLAQPSFSLTVDWTPADLTGIDALGHLEELSISSQCYLVMSDQYVPCDSSHCSIPAWPDGLLALRLNRGTWSTLPPFPINLNLLHLNVTGMPVIPTLPEGITDLGLVDKSTLSTLPELPASVLRLSITSIGHAIPDLPGGLAYLNLHGVTGITVPPMPNALDSIYLSSFGDAAITAWPTAARLIKLTGMSNLMQVADWPPALQVLQIHGAPNLAQLPPVWSSTLANLQLWHTDALAALPAFPPGLETIGLASYGLDSLPAALVSLPPWPIGIQYIFLASMPFTDLPPLPAGLQVLDISYLPELTCLPLLPEGLSTLLVDVDGLSLPPTPITCVPNFPPNALINWGGSVINNNPDLLCTALNSSCPFLNPVATGTSYWDQNANGTRDSGEPGYPYVTLHQQPGSAMHGVATDGTYAWPMPIGTYTLSASSDNPYVQGIAPAQHTLSFTVAGEVSTGNDFGVTLQPNVQDLRIDLMGPAGQPGFDSYGTITCENLGSIPTDATVTFQLDAIQSWVGATPAPSTVAMNTITWNLAALQVGETRQIALVVHTGSTVALGTPLVQTAEAGPLASDASPDDNVSTFEAEVVGSYDPNDKQVLPHTLSLAEVAAGNEELIYTIRFQNTGTWPAVKVKVADTLSSDLQWTTFRKVSSSHACNWELSGAGVLSFQFDPIDLPDSVTNEPLSHGFVKFAIKPRTTLPLGTTVANSADIFFDFNAPVRTLPAVFTVDDGSGVPETGPAAMHVYPNPVRDVLWVNLPTSAHTILQVFDARGREHIRQVAVSKEVTSVPMQGLAPGPYSLRCTSERGTWATKFLKR